MNGPMLKKMIPATLALASVLALGGAKAMQQSTDAGQAAAQPSDGQAAGQRSDGQIEMDVVHALDASSALKDDWNVDRALFRVPSAEICVVSA